MINKLNKLIAKLPKDKLLHFIVAYVLFDVFLNIIVKFNLDVFTTIYIDFFILTILIFGKEYVDKNSYGDFNWKDILAGYIGVVSKILVFLMTI